MQISVSIKLTNWKSKIRKRTDLTEVELKEILDVYLQFVLIKSTTMFQYFYKKILYVVPSITKIKGGRRFKSFLQNLQMEGNGQNDPFKNVRPIIKMFILNIRRIYYPKRELCLDESRMSWRGRFCFRQYNKKNMSLNQIL